ncbi:MAG TPA: cobalamin-dependent protein [Anaeromyxobacter sp.]|nr:cobalamin-dependent protein [Anaeromyxobacter sp.]
MNDILPRLSLCVESGKVNQAAAYPPKMKGQPGADELCREAIAAGVPPAQILEEGLVSGMARIGERFSQGKAFVPEMLLAARAMTAAMAHLRPFFTSGEVKRRGVFVVGTVAGDLHDIGKNIVAMMVEGAGWEVVDLGVDVKAERFLAEIEKHPGCVVGLSALLTTTMVNMEKIVADIRARHPALNVFVGGAPVNQEFCKRIGASFYSPDPQGVVERLKTLAA